MHGHFDFLGDCLSVDVDEAKGAVRAAGDDVGGGVEVEVGEGVLGAFEIKFAAFGLFVDAENCEFCVVAGYHKLAIIRHLKIHNRMS